MSHDDLRHLLVSVAEEVGHMPQREFTRPAWQRARRLRRRRIAMGAAAAVLVVGAPVALLATRDDPTVRPAPPVYSDMPLRSRAAHTATLLADGRVLIIGGCATDGCTTADGEPTTEFYVPGHGFTAGPDMLEPRQGHSATVLPDGRILIAGGWPREGTAPLSSAEVYEPETGRFEPTGSLSMGRGGATAIPLADGRVLVAGGQIAGGESTATAEVFDPRRNAFTPVAPMPEPRDAAVSIALPDGRVLVAGGQDSRGAALSTALLYDPEADTWLPTGSLSTPRNKAAIAALPDGRVLVLGGATDDDHVLQTTEIYDPATGTFGPGPAMDVQRYKLAVTASTDGRLVVVGGTQLAVFEDGQFHRLPVAAGPTRWFTTITSLPDGDVLIVGGYDERIRLHPDAQLIEADLITGQGQP